MMTEPFYAPNEVGSLDEGANDYICVTLHELRNHLHIVIIVFSVGVHGCIWNAQNAICDAYCVIITARWIASFHSTIVFQAMTVTFGNFGSSSYATTTTWAIIVAVFTGTPLLALGSFHWHHMHKLLSSYFIDYTSLISTRYRYRIIARVVSGVC